MRTILIIGIGTGHPDHLTLQAIDALRRADVVFIPDKGQEKAALRRQREAVCARFLTPGAYRTVEIAVPRRAADAPSYRAGVDDWHRDLATLYRGVIDTHLPDGACGAFLVWGDPALYDSTLRILDAIAASGADLACEVIPGISAPQVLAARHRVPLNRIGEAVLITTGRRLAEDFPTAPGSVVVMLDGEQAFRQLAAEDVDIWWGAYLGSEHEILIAGRLAEVAEEIEETRRRARAAHGWIMDTYLLRKARPSRADEGEGAEAGNSRRTDGGESV